MKIENIPGGLRINGEFTTAKSVRAARRFSPGIFERRCSICNVRESLHDEKHGFSPKAWTPEVALLQTMFNEAARCPKCDALAVVPLTRAQWKKQPDDTTHVCHPSLQGCNHGFTMNGFAAAAEANEEHGR